MQRVDMQDQHRAGVSRTWQDSQPREHCRKRRLDAGRRQP